MSEQAVVETPAAEETTLLGTEVAPNVKEAAKETAKAEVKADPKEVSLYDQEKPKEGTPEAKAAVEAENKRLLEADDKTLKPEELAKKQELVKAQADAANVVPEKYDIKLKDGEIDAKTLEALSPVFKELKLTNANVQKLAEAYAPVVKAQVEANQTAAADGWKKTIDGWKAETVKVLGADYAKELSFAAKVIDRFGDKTKGADGKEVNSLRQLFDETGVGNHPALVGALVKVGKLISEDHFAEGSKLAGKGSVSLYDHPTSVETLKK